MSFIELHNIEKQYGKGASSVEALKNITLNIEEGEFIAIMGKSGSGKSTLLNILGKVSQPSNGKYFFDGEDVSKLSSSRAAAFRSKNIGFVVQHFALIQEMTVYQNIALPMIYKKYSSKRIKERVSELLNLLEIEDKKNKYPSELSGGQCQRVAIARAIATNPKLLLADEPTGALDEMTGLKIMEILKKLNDNGITILIVTHDADVARCCKRQLYMKEGEMK